MHYQKGVVYMTQKEIKSYCKEKRRFLKDFAIYLKDEEFEHMLNLKTEIAIDNYCKTIMDNHL